MARKRMKVWQQQEWAFELGTAALYGQMRLVPPEDRPTVEEEGASRPMTDEEYLPLFAAQVEAAQAKRQRQFQRSRRALDRQQHKGLTGRYPSSASSHKGA